MALKKSQLYSTLWKSCDELRGGMDASQYKDYVLTLLFMKYVTDKYAGKSNALVLIPDGGSFADMAALKGTPDIGDRMNKIIAKLAENNELQGVLTQADFNDENKLGRGKEMQDRLSKLVAIFETLDFRTNRAEGDDLLGDAYEYLMRNFATESGKSKGQFYTPAEVSTIMAKIIGVGPDTQRTQTVYDPTAGSGSLLLKAANEAPKGITIYGQEMDNVTWALAKMNLILHDQPTAELWRANTLADPYFKNLDGSLKTFDYAVANPPFSTKAWSNGLDPEHDPFGRFEYGIPPKKNGDYAFLLHLVKSLKSAGKGAIIMPHGVLFRGGKEADIRRNLVKRGLIKGIIGLPSNLFYGTGIPACIVVIDKENANIRSEIFMLDASKGFIKDGNKNRLRSQDIRKIVEVFNHQMELPKYSRRVPISEISSSANDYNLNLPRYIDTSDPEDLHDLDAHLNGGIPERDIDELREYWDELPSLRQVLFANNGRPGYCEPIVESHRVKEVVLSHPEFVGFSNQILSVFEDWRKNQTPTLKSIDQNTLPKKVITKLSDDLLERIAPLPLLDRYDAYQKLMDYWTDSMQDDVYLIVANGWKESAMPRAQLESGEAPDLVIEKRKFKMDLIPPELIIGRYFKERKDRIEELQSKLDGANQELEEYIEEHTGEEEGLLNEVVNEKGKVSKTTLNKRIQAIGKDPDYEDERQAILECSERLNESAELSAEIKREETALNQDVLAKYKQLSEDEIKTLVVDEKWFSSIWKGIEGEVQRLTQRLTNRIKELEERYRDPLPKLEGEVEELRVKVDGHLKRMGLTWNG